MDNQEIDLRELFLFLWRKKIIIIGFSLLAAVLVLIYSLLFIENTFMASSTILVTPFEYEEISVVDVPFGVYLNIAKSDSILQKIIKDLDLKNKDGQPLTASKMKKMLTVKLNEDYTKVGYLTFEARTTDANISRDIVNSWAAIMLNDILLSRKSNLERVYDNVNQQYQEVEEKLAQAKLNLLAHKELSRLERLENTMFNYREQADENEKSLISLQLSLALKKSQLTKTLEYIKNQEGENGAWLGVLSGDYQLADIGLEFETVRSYKILADTLLNFQKSNDIRGKEAQLNFLEKKLIDYKNEKKNLEKELNLLTIEKKEIEQLLAMEPERWIKEKSFGEDKLWDRIFTPEDLAIMSQITLSEEVINPVYERLRNRHTEALVNYVAIPNQISYLNRCLVELEMDLEKTHKEVTDLKDKEDKIIKDLGLYEGLYKQQQNEFSNLKKKAFSLELEIDSLETEVQTLKQENEERLAHLAVVEEQFWQMESERMTLEGKVTEYEALYWQLSNRIEQTNLLTSQKEQDAHLVTEALYPGEAISKGTMTKTAIAGVLACMLIVLALLFSEFIKGTDDKINYLKSRVQVKEEEI